MEVRAIENYDHCLHFQVLDKRISCIDESSPEVVADNRGNICIRIEFDDQWDGCTKVARFIYNGMWKDVVLDASNECICPSEVVKKGRFALGVYGENLKVTTPIFITAVPSILSDSEGELPDAPTDDVYQQILKITSEANTAADEATKACWEAVEATSEAVQALNKAKEELEEGGFVNSIKEMHNQEKFTVWIGTIAEYSSLANRAPNCLYILTDEPSTSDVVDKALSVHKGEFSHMEESVDHPGCFFTRVNGKKEWVSPPTVQGELYPTIERFRGNQVFSLSISVAVPSGQTIDIVTNDYTHIVEIAGIESYEYDAGKTGFRNLDFKSDVNVYYEMVFNPGLQYAWKITNVRESDIFAELKIKFF